MRPQQQRGRRGEALAAHFLTHRGYEILARNYRTRRGEIDLIARDGKTVVFVEVKARTGSRFGSPCEAVDAKKQQRLRLAAEEWLCQQEEVPFCRFDVIEVYLPAEPDEEFRIRQLTDAF